MYLKEYLEVAPTAGITTLAKFLFEKKQSFFCNRLVDKT